MDKKKIAMALTLGLFLSACGSDTKPEQSTENSNEKSVEKSQNAAKSAQAEAKLIATEPAAIANVTVEKAEGQAMDLVKDKLAAWQQGKVQFLNFEGGFYGIITESGQRLLPMNLPAEFRQNGAVVRVKGKFKDVMTIQQWGKPFTISEIELISKGSTPGDDRT